MGKRRPFYVEFENAIDLAQSCHTRLEDHSIRNAVLDAGYNFIQFVITNRLVHFASKDTDDVRSYIWEKLISDWYPRVDWFRSKGEIIAYLINVVHGFALNYFRKECLLINSCKYLAPFSMDSHAAHTPQSLEEEHKIEEDVVELSRYVNFSGDPEVALRVACILVRRGTSEDVYRVRDFPVFLDEDGR